MSWYKDPSEDSAIQVEDSPKKESSYVQVPTSSPIHVKSSPTKSNNDLMPPSRTQINNGSGDNEDKERKLEAKRQAIRNHKDFPMVKRRFYYLQESDIFKGFVKGKGNLREITQWLTDNYNKAEILGRHEAELKRQRELGQEEKMKQEKERLLREYQRQEEINQRREQEEKERSEKEGQNIDDQYDDEDLSPIKVRGKARIKSAAPPPPPPPVLLESPEKQSSTKVHISKPKVSILDKYKYKPKQQPSIDQVFRPQEDIQPKRRKLVRASTVSSGDDSNRGSPVAATFNYQDQYVPKLKMTMNGHAVESDQSNRGDDGIVEDDDLEKLEEKIKANRRAAKASKNDRVIEVSDNDLEDDDMSDDMSEEDDDEGYKTGLTTIDSQILEFLNNASTQDIIEICNVPPKVSELIITKRPFQNIYVVAEDKFELPSENTEESGNEKKRRVQRKTLGQKIIENTEFSLKGYKAVDSLIKKCSEYGDLISKQMEKWGVTITGEGELEMVDLEPTQNAIEIEDKDDYEEEDEDIIVHHKSKSLTYIKEKPSLLPEDIDLKNYQQVGINWLNLLYRNNLSCILADEMGLGKTCQVISFMAHLKETETKKGPHLVIVPSSTLENWLREFNKFCPDLMVQAYYGSQSEREELRYDLQNSDYDVMVTTYNLATGAAPDFKFMRNQNFNMIVYDEGHMLKNSTSERYNKLMRLNAKYRLLLTGTPLQNNLKELVSLLAFMLPNLFNDKREDLQGLFNQKVSTVDSSEGNYNPLLSLQAIAKAKTMMTPFVLRRKKVQVLKHLPGKIHKIENCELTPTQRAIYDDYLNQGKRTRIERERRKKLSSKENEKAKKNAIPSSSNVMMSLRKASLHPLLFRTLFTDEKVAKMAKAIMNEPEYFDANQTYILEDMKVMADYELNNLCEKFPKTLSKFVLQDEDWLNGGKISKLIEILDKIINKKEKVLIFSLFTQMLDILEKVLTISNMKFLRLDGQTSVDTRQDLIDKFYDDETIPVFLLSTKAGGFGINLVAANHVIIFDQSFNPHDDKQAEDRAHRVGQTSEVVVTKLIAKNTIEENMLQLAENKLQLDQSISSNELTDSKFEEKAASLFEKLLFDN